MELHSYCSTVPKTCKGNRLAVQEVDFLVLFSGWCYFSRRLLPVYFLVLWIFQDFFSCRVNISAVIFAFLLWGERSIKDVTTPSFHSWGVTANSPVRSVSTFLGNPEAVLPHGDRGTRSTVALDLWFLHTPQRNFTQGTKEMEDKGAQPDFGKKDQTHPQVLPAMGLAGLAKRGKESDRRVCS